jgi:hypothetical protein
MNEIGKIEAFQAALIESLQSDIKKLFAEIARLRGQIARHSAPVPLRPGKSAAPIVRPSADK